MAVANITSCSDEKIDEEFYKPTESRKALNGNEIFSTIYQPCAQAKLYKRSLFDGIRYPVGRLYEDTFIYHDILARVNSLVLTGLNTYFYLIRSDSIMHQEYKLAFTDIIDSIEMRVKKLEELGLQDLADDNRVFIYSRVAVAYANLDSSVPENKKRLEEIKAIYNEEYPKLMKTTNTSKQKFRYWLLRNNPNLHSKLFGKNMSLALG